MGTISQIVLGLIGCTIVLLGMSLLIGLSYAYDKTSPFYISSDGRYGYKKSRLERLIDALELYAKL